jgi:hypothetical protein
VRMMLSKDKNSFMERQNPSRPAHAASIPQLAPGLGTTNLPNGHVYFLVMKERFDTERDLVPVKIGITRGDIARRLTTLQTGNPYNLSCFGSFKTPWTREVEHFMHKSHEMLQNEWLLWRRDDLHTLVVEAKEAERQIEERKRREQTAIALILGGPERPATHEVICLHREAQALMKRMIPERLRREIAENRLKSATGTMVGITGIVRVKYLPATIRFSARLARLQLLELESKYPELTAECFSIASSGGFRWRGRPTRPDLASEFDAALSARNAAMASVDEVLKGKVSLGDWGSRTPTLQRWHDDFLDASRVIHKLGVELAELQAALTAHLAENSASAFIGVCSFKRSSVLRLQRAVFCRNFPEESTRCAEPVAPQLRKQVYATRSYLQAGEMIE